MEINYDKTSHFAALEHGKVHYHEIGSGPALLLIHGSGPGVTGWANFQGNLAVFSQKFRCIVIDLPGYGKSDLVEGNPIEVCVTACLGLLEALNIKQAHIIGNSLGGMVGSQIAATQHELVTSFTTIGGVGLNIFTAFPAEGLNLLTAFTEDPTRERVVTWLKSMVYDQSIISDELVDSRFAQAIEPNTLATTKKLYSTKSIQEITKFREGAHVTKSIEHLSSIQAPTLITWGRDDRVSPLDGCLIPMRLIPNCEVHIFPKCGHWAMIECKDKFESLVMGFLLLNEPTFSKVK